MPGLQLEDVFEHGSRSRHISQGEVHIERLMVDFPGHARILQERFDLRGKNEKVFAGVVVQGLNSQPIPD
jgi:hypothetical protein